MLGTIINTILVFAGSIIGLLFKSKIKQEYSDACMAGLALCVAAIGIQNAIKTNDILCVIISMVIGIFIGEALKIEDRIESLGETLKTRLMKNHGGGRFAEGFMSSTLLFCVGSMAVMGAMESGINHNYTILISKGVIDAFAAMTLSATMGIGVLFSGFSVFIYQGALTLIAIFAGNIIPDYIVTEMSAVGGIILIGIAINMLNMLGEKRIRVGNMLPAIFTPIAYLLITGLF